MLTGDNGEHRISGENILGFDAAGWNLPPFPETLGHITKTGKLISGDVPLLDKPAAGHFDINKAQPGDVVRLKEDGELALVVRGDGGKFITVHFAPYMGDPTRFMDYASHRVGKLQFDRQVVEEEPKAFSLEDYRCGDILKRDDGLEFIVMLSDSRDNSSKTLFWLPTNGGITPCPHTIRRESSFTKIGRMNGTEFIAEAEEPTTDIISPDAVASLPAGTVVESDDDTIFIVVDVDGDEFIADEHKFGNKCLVLVCGGLKHVELAMGLANSIKDGTRKLIKNHGHFSDLFTQPTE